MVHKRAGWRRGGDGGRQHLVILFFNLNAQLYCADFYFAELVVGMQTQNFKNVLGFWCYL